MPTLEQTGRPPSHAVVAKMETSAADSERYLLVTPAGQAIWIDDPAAATPFSSMREAIRMALRLPSGHRAFGLLRDVELDLRRPH